MQSNDSAGGDEHWRTRRSGRKWVTASMAGGAALVAVLFLLPNVAGAAVGSSTVITAPFKGTPYDFGGAGFAGCGTTLKITAMPSFNIQNGNSSFNAATSAKACADLSTTDYSDAYGQVGYNGSQWTQAKTGSATITALYNLSWSASLSAKPSKGQSASASVVIIEELEVSYAHNGTGIAFALAFPLDLSKTTGSSTSTKSDDMFKLVTSSVTLTKGKSYYVTVYLYIEVDTSVNAAGTSSASAAVNLEPTGHQSKLVSITIS
jgi:hypothetical protein